MGVTPGCVRRRAAGSSPALRALHNRCSSTKLTTRSNAKSPLYFLAGAPILTEAEKLFSPILMQNRNAKMNQTKVSVADVRTGVHVCSRGHYSNMRRDHWLCSHAPKQTRSSPTQPPAESSDSPQSAPSEVRVGGAPAPERRRGGQLTHISDRPTGLRFCSRGYY